MNTTDNKAEPFDLVDENDAVIGVITRPEVHRDPTLIHRAVSVLVYNNEGKLFLQKRSQAKDTDAGLWSISAAGHVSQGQSYANAARRELMEELGVTAPLKFYKRYLIKTAQETEINAIYGTRHNGPFRLNTTEIVDGGFFSLTDIERKIKTGKFQLSDGSLANLYLIAGILKHRQDIAAMILRTYETNSGSVPTLSLL